MASSIPFIGFPLTRLLTQDAVLTIPGRPEWNRPAHAFDGADWSHREQMWIARVALFFRCNFRRPGDGNPLIPCQLALVNRLRTFTVPEARKSPADYRCCQWQLELLNYVLCRGTASGKGHAHSVRVLSDSRPSSHSGNEHHHQGLSGSLLLGWHVATSHHSSSVSFFGEAPFRRRTYRQGCALR